MKKKEVQRLSRALTQRFPCLRHHGHSLYVTPVESLCLGLDFESSSFSAEKFYLWCYWFPLYIPTEVIHYNFGFRVRNAESGRDDWNTTSVDLQGSLAESIESQAIPLFERVLNEGAVSELSRATSRSPDNPYAWQAYAFALAEAGDFEESHEIIARLLGMLDPECVAWHRKLIDNATGLRSAIECGPAHVQDRLGVWKRDTVMRLGLQAIYSGE